MRELALFAGAGGGILGGRLLGWRTVCAVEAAAYPRRVLLARQRDGILDPFPIWDDVRTFDGHPWRGHVDVISGGFPCQDISQAGKGAGITGKKSGLWSEMARIIGEVRPSAVFVENSPFLVRRGLNVVLGDLASMGYDAGWCVLGARHVGAPHKRDRLWLMARDADSHCKPTLPIDAEVARMPTLDKVWPSWWDTEPDGLRVGHGLACRMDRLRAIGNGQVPSVAALAWCILNEHMIKESKREQR